MPLYEYRCEACRKGFEALLDRWDAPTPPCPHCGGVGAKRQLSVFAVSAGSGTEMRGCGEPGACGAGGCGCCPSSN